MPGKPFSGKAKKAQLKAKKVKKEVSIFLLAYDCHNIAKRLLYDQLLQKSVLN